MKGGKHLADPAASLPAAEMPIQKRKKLILAAIAVFLLAAAAVGGTVALLLTQTDPVQNKFEPSRVACDVKEVFQNNQKTSIKVQNTGDIPAYVRLRFVTYRVNDAGEHIGGTASIPGFTLNSQWVKDGDCYYCKAPVSPGSLSPELFANGSSILLESYTDADGGKQVVEVMAEAIQSEPASAANDAWGVNLYGAG